MRVFLSYSTPDEHSAKELRLRLSAAGFTVWDAQHDVLPGDNWAAEVARALERSDAMVVLISPESVESESVRRDLEYALGSKAFKGRLIPVVVRPTKKVPWILRTLQHVELKKDLGRATKEITKALRQPSKPAARAAAQ
jgi:hypothetical protein